MSADPQGLAFAALAEDYDLGRPPWPASILEGIDGGSAVEPLAGMRALLERNLYREAVAHLPAPGGSKPQTGEWKRGFDGAPFAPFDEQEHRHTSLLPDATYRLDIGAHVFRTVRS